jgi:hypothetical protein
LYPTFWVITVVSFVKSPLSPNPGSGVFAEVTFTQVKHQNQLPSPGSGVSTIVTTQVKHQNQLPNPPPHNARYHLF